MARRSRTWSAYDLHTTVPAERWGISWNDLCFLREELYTAIEKGELVEDDEDHGPNFYAVNEQYVKPVTERAGKMSWALMRNPSGVECEIFISHAWQEGVFEFLRKLRHSWPCSMQHAWCCILANPQHLDLAAMLAAPKTSPFAHALRAAHLVLVVPNHRESVYTRLWCAYEAYLAKEEGTDILIAQSPDWQSTMHAFAQMFCAAILGAIFGSLFLVLELHGSTDTIRVCAILAFSLSLILEDDTARHWLHLLCEGFSWFEAVYPNVIFVAKWQDEEYALHVVHRYYWICMALLFLIMERDRVNGLTTMREESELRQNFESIREAKCTKPEDEVAIWQEIGSKADDMDRCIEVLLTAGMSTPRLRQAALRGVDITSAAFSEVGAAVYCLGPLGFESGAVIIISVAHRDGWYLMILPALLLFIKLILILVLCFSARDEQQFILKVFSKLLVLFVFTAIVVVAIFFHDRAPAQLWLLIMILLLLAALCFALLGINGTARLRPGLLQLFLSRGQRALRACGSDSESESS